MPYGPTLGALVTTTFARSAPPRHRGRPSRRRRLAPRIVAVCAALVVAVTPAVAIGVAPSAVARPITAPPRHVVSPGTADQPESDSGGPHLSGLRPAAAATPSESSGFAWGAVAIGSGLALGLFGLAMSRARSRKRTGPAALSQ